MNETKYSKEIEGTISLSITNDNKATINDLSEEIEVTVQLADDAEATKMIAEFEDADGELMYKEDSIYGKYDDLHQFRP